MKPSQLPDPAQIDGPVAVDTETSGLHPDDGARVSTVSVAWVLRDERGQEWQQLQAHAWPFWQGLEGKPEAENGIQGDLFQDGMSQYANLPQPEWSALMEWLVRVGDANGLVFHNAKFDLWMLGEGTGAYGGSGRDGGQPHTAGGGGGVDLSAYLEWDTSLAAGILMPDVRDPKTRRVTRSLKPISQALWGLDQGDEQQVVKSYLKANRLPAGRWDLIPWSVIGSYASKDAELTLRLYQHQQHLLEVATESARGRAQWQLQLDLEVCRTLLRMERRGVPYDAAGSKQAADQCGAEAQRVAKLLPWSPATTPAATDWYFDPNGGKRGDGMRLQPYATTAGGRPSLTESVVRKMVKRGIAGAKEWADYNKLTHARTMWYSAYSDMTGPDGKIRTTFRQTGTISGRFSCERLNLQAIPQDYRLGGETGPLGRLGVPTPRGLIAQGVAKLGSPAQLWEFDLAQAELRVAAMYAECGSMLQMIREGKDLHGVTATELFGVGPDDPDWDFSRQVAKRANFAMIFGVGAETFRQAVEKETGVEMPLAQATQIVRHWNGLYPEYAAAITSYQQQVEQRLNRSRNLSKRNRARGSGDAFPTGWVDTWGGGRRWYQVFDDTSSAFNQAVQGSLAILNKRWLVQCAQQTEQMLLDAGHPVDSYGQVLSIHDSQMYLIPDDEQLAGKVAQAVADSGTGIWDAMFSGLPGAVGGGVEAKKIG